VGSMARPEREKEKRNIEERSDESEEGYEEG
jgi:hypothetical protein